MIQKREGQTEMFNSLNCKHRDIPNVSFSAAFLAI
jgi:hypothetical protein